MQSAATEPELEASSSLNKPLTQPLMTSTEKYSVPFLPKTETEMCISKSPVATLVDERTPKEEAVDEEETKEMVFDVEDNVASEIPLSPVHKVGLDSLTPDSSDTALADDIYSSSSLEADQFSPSVLSTPVSEEVYPDLPVVPLYVELTEDQKRNVRKLAVERIIDSYKHLQGTDYKQTRMSLLARLVAQVGPTLLLIGYLYVALSCFFVSPFGDYL